MNEYIKNFIGFIVQLLIFLWIAGLAIQLLTPRGIIGAYFEKNDNNQVIISSLSDLKPAREAGLMVGDRILSVNGESVEGRNAYYVASKVKGKPGTVVNVRVKRDDKVLEYSIKRINKKIDWFYYF